MTRTAAREGLYDPEPEIPALLGSRCAECGTNFFPALAIGCECCGAADLKPIRLQSAGTVQATATVHLHRGKDIAAPFTVAEILLDDGPLVRALLAEVTDDDVIGARVAGEWIKTGQDEPGTDRVEPRFRLLRPDAEQ